MKFSIKTIAILVAAASIYSCHSGDTTPTVTNGADSGTASKDSGMTGSTSDTSHKAAATASVSPEQDFINYAVPANTKEIIWLKAGLSKGAKDIKEHSAMMLKDHEKLGATVKGWLAKNSSITMPAIDTTNEVNINDKTGADWDKAWVDKLSSAHNDLLDHLKTAQAAVKDSSLNKIITGTIPVVQSHIAMVKSMQDKHSK